MTKKLRIVSDGTGDELPLGKPPEDTDEKPMRRIEVPTELPDDARQVTVRVRELDEQTRDLQIGNPEEYESLGEVLKSLHTHSKALTDKRLSLTRPLDDVKRGIMDLFRQPLDLLDQIEKRIQAAMLTYRRQENERQQREAAAAQQLARKQQEEAALNQAIKLEAQGRPDAAAATLERAQTTPLAPVVSQPVAPAVRGVSFKKVVEFAIESPDDVPREYLIVDERKVAERVKVYGLRHGIPGVVAWEEEQVAQIRTR